jgi:glycosyltransferase involved in cell wall biosynthesis
MDTLSIVTPVYNDPRLEHCLESILAQADAPPVELIVVDGESTDETVDVIDSYRDQIDTLVSEPDDGIYDAMNKGIDRASGDVVGILNADDRYNDDSVLRDVFNRLQETGAQACYGDLVYVDEDDSVVRHWESGPYTRRRMYFGWMPPHPTVFLRRELYEQYGTFDTDLDIAADYDLILRLFMRHDIDVAYVNRVLVRMATGGKSNESIGNIVQSNREVYRSWRRNGLRGGAIVPFCKVIRKIPQFFSGDASLR